jgi:hypothetical protein
MTKVIEQTAKAEATAAELKLEAAWAAIVAFMPDPVVSVKSGDSGFIAQCDARKVAPKVGLELLRQGIIKPLTDISRDKQIEETWEQTHKRRLARIANWYAGDFSVRGGGVADPVGVQMKEEISNAYKAAGVTGADLKEAVKGRADEILARVYEGDELKERLAHYRAKAEATLATRRAAADKLPDIKVNIKSLKI